MAFGGDTGGSRKNEFHWFDGTTWTKNKNGHLAAARTGHR